MEFTNSVGYLNYSYWPTRTRVTVQESIQVFSLPVEVRSTWDVGTDGGRTAELWFHQEGTYRGSRGVWPSQTLVLTRRQWIHVLW